MSNSARTTHANRLRRDAWKYLADARAYRASVCARLDGPDPADTRTISQLVAAARITMHTYLKTRVKWR